MEKRIFENEIVLFLAIICDSFGVQIAKIVYEKQNEWVRIGEESLGVLCQKNVTLRSDRKSLWKDKYTK